MKKLLGMILTLALAAGLAWPGYAESSTVPPEVTAHAYLVMDAQTGQVLVQKGGAERNYPASITKIMTLALAMEKCGGDMTQQVTVSPDAVYSLEAGSSHVALQPGEVVSLNDLFHATILASANDAASVIASDVSGGDLTAFVAQMNARAKELGCTDTTFSCVHGLYDYGNVSTAEDLAKIAAACYANETYMQVANTQSYTLPATNLHQNERAITSTNLMLNPEYAYYRDYIRGMKTGFTTQAGRCFVTFAQQDGHTYGLVILGSNSQNIFREAAELFDWAFTSPELHPAPAKPEAEPEKHGLSAFWHKVFG